MSPKIDSTSKEHVKMADDEKEETIAEENIALEPSEDVFLNGEANGDATCRAEDGEEEGEEEDQNGINDNLPGSVLPRRSSLMKKDASKRPQRKKTVSFSSVDKKIATGKTSYYCCISCDACASSVRCVVSGFRL